jgi:high affinity sulfate transporter 1
VVVYARSWLASYQRAWIRPDVAAGITLAAYLLPSGLGDASLAGLPPEAGLYACLFGGLVFWLFCSSRHTAVTVTSAISLLVGATLGEIAAGDPIRHAALASCTALLVAGIAFAAYAVRAGTLVNFFSETVLIGFKCGVALFLSSTQLPKLFGFSGGHGGDFWVRMGHFFHGLGDTNPASLTLGLIALGLLLLGKTIFKGRPVALFVVIGAIVAARVMHLDQYRVALLGEVPQGLPTPALPAVSWTDMHELLPLAMACFMLAAVETTAIGRMFAAKHGYRLDATQEFLAIGSANLMAGLGRGFPISGGMSQSLVNETGGARTPLSGLIAAVVTLIIVVFFTGLLRTLPQPVLAAVVLMAVTGLIQISALRQIWRFSRSEFAVAMAALMGVLAAGLLQGVLIGVVISIILLIRRAARPRVAEVARVPGTSYFADLARHPENTREPGVVVVRPEGSILYFNVDHVRDALVAIVRAQPTAPRLVILFMGNVPHVDFAGAELLVHLREDFKERGIDFGLAETHGEVREALQRLGDHHAAGLTEANQTVDDVLGYWNRAHRSPAAPTTPAGPTA